jgi:DNA-binding PadR family transcriptional regulator
MHTYIHPFHHPAARWFAMNPGPGPGRRGHRGHRGPGPGGGRGPHGPRARRGDVRAALLVLLAEEPRNGYGLMQEIEQRSEGAWRPSPGSVYPALAQLEDEGLVRTDEQDGRRVFVITDAGRAWVAERDDAPAPWDASRHGAGHGPRQLIGLARDVGLATAQLVRVGDEGQIARAREALIATRRSLYRILADDPEEPGAEGPPAQEV